jgi:predicted nucleic acid-binding protein
VAIVDASVFVAAFRADDPAHGAAVAWLRAALVAGSPIAAPAIVLGEVSAAVRRRTGDAGLARSVLAELRALPGLRIEPLTSELADRAAELAADHALRGHDAVYVAVAEQLGSRLVTLDLEMLVRGADLVSTSRPEAPPAVTEGEPPP